MPLDQDLKEAVKKNLPEHVSKELRERLELVDDLLEEAKDLGEENKRLESELKELKRREYEFYLFSHEKEDLKQEKQKFEIEKREYKIQCLEEKYGDVKSLMHDVFRNQRMVYQTSGYENIQGMTSRGETVNSNRSVDTTTEMVEE